MPRRSLLTGVLLGAGSVLGTVLVRRRAARRRERVDLYFDDGSMVSLTGTSPEAKEYGTAKRLEGVFEPGARTCLVEDVVTSGGAALSAVKALREAGLECGNAVCVVDREEGGVDELARHAVRLRPLFRAGEILE